MGAIRPGPLRVVSTADDCGGLVGSAGRILTGRSFRVTGRPGLGFLCGRSIEPGSTGIAGTPGDQDGYFCAASRTVGYTIYVPASNEVGLV